MAINSTVYEKSNSLMNSLEGFDAQRSENFSLWTTNYCIYPFLRLKCLLFTSSYSCYTDRSGIDNKSVYIIHKEGTALTADLIIRFHFSHSLDLPPLQFTQQQHSNVVKTLFLHFFYCILKGRQRLLLLEEIIQSLPHQSTKVGV